MQTTTVTCDLCSRAIEKPKPFGETIHIERGGQGFDVCISVEYPAIKCKPVGSLDTCTDCFWAAVKEAVKNHVTWS